MANNTEKNDEDEVIREYKANGKLIGITVIAETGVLPLSIGELAQ